jgi:peptide-methionine (S)-S-oxide reductase
MFKNVKTIMPTAENALPGRTVPIAVSPLHYVHQRPMQGDFIGKHKVCFAMGCFWGAERCFWSQEGVYTTAVGYAGGYTPNPSYEEVCSGQSGHTEGVRVVFDPKLIAFEDLLRIFWESHDPTQGMRQGNDTGTQYRSAIYVEQDTHLIEAMTSQKLYQKALTHKSHHTITTEIKIDPVFYLAEDHHQQYLAKNPGGYCGLGGTGVKCSISSS